MTKEITKTIILQEIQNKFGLRDFEAARFLFDEVVIPVYNIEPHLKELVNTYVEKSITGTGAFLLFNVPPTEKWTLHRYDVVFMGAGAYTVSGVFTMRDPLVSTKFCYLDLTAGQTISYHVGLEQPIELASGNQIYVNIDGYTSTQNLRFYVDYTREVVR